MDRLRALLGKLTRRRDDGSLGRDLSVAFLGHGARRALGFVTFLVMTRALSVEAYALYVLAYSAFEIAMYVSDLGLNVGIVRFVAKGLRQGEAAATAAVLRGVFLFKIVAGVVAPIVGYALAPWLAGWVWDRPELVPYLRVAFAGVLGAHLHRFYEAWFRARLEFARNALFSLVMPGSILVAVAVLVWQDALTALRCQGIYAIAPLLACALAAGLLPHAFLRSRESAGAALATVWRFGRWVWITNVLGTVRLRLNPILLANLSAFTEVGLYAYADKLASILSLISTAMTTVYVPRASHLVTRDEFRGLLRRSYRVLVWFIPAAILLPLAARPLIRLHKPEYEDATQLFAILFASVLFTVASLPARTVLYSLHKPQVEAAVQITSLAITVAAAIPLIMTYGAIGAALSMLIQRALGAGVLMAYVYRVIERPAAGAMGDGAEDA
jgi:O-antigen/teichoic acid export membrane protein